MLSIDINQNTQLAQQNWCVSACGIQSLKIKYGIRILTHSVLEQLEFNMLNIEFVKFGQVARFWILSKW